MKSIRLICLLIFIAPGLHAQDAVYYYASDMSEIKSEDGATYMKNVDYKNGRKVRVSTFKRSESDWKVIKQERFVKKSPNSWSIRSSEDKVFSPRLSRSFSSATGGHTRFTDELKGKVLRSGTCSRTLPLHLQDTVRFYYPNASLRSLAVYHNNVLVSNRNWLRNGAEYIDDLIHYVDKVPEHSQGQVFFKHYMLDGIREAGIDLSQVNDMVVIGMVIRSDGNLDGLHLVQGRFRELNNTIMQLLKDMPGNWVAATLHGKTVNYYMELPFNFRHQEEGFDSLELSSGFVVWD